MDAKPKATTTSKVLKQRGLPIPGIAAQDDEPDFSTQNVVIQRVFKRGFNVGLPGERCVEAAGLAIAPAGAGVGLQ